MAGATAPEETQSSFSAGEVSPECYGRTDIPTYKQALRLCRNFIPTKHGSLKNRPGTKFVAVAKNPTGTPPRLIPFVFSDQQSFLLEVGDKYIRFYTDGAPVVVSGVADYSAVATYAVGDLVAQGGLNYYCIAPTTNNPPGNPVYWYTLSGNIYEIPSPWAIADVMRLKYAQAGDVVTVVHPRYAPQNIERLGNTDWVIAPTLLSPPAYPGPAVTSPSFQILPLEQEMAAGGGTTPIKMYNSTVNYTDAAGDYVNYVTPGLPGGQAMTYFATNPVVQSVLTPGDRAQAPSGTTGPLAASALNWILYSWCYTLQYLTNQYVYAQNLQPFGIEIFGSETNAAPNLSGALYQCLTPNVGDDPNLSIVANDGKWALAAGSTHPASVVTYAITMTLLDGRGVEVESLPSFYSPPGGMFPRYPDRPLALQFYPPGSPPVPTGYTVLGFNVYCGSNGLYGLIGSVGRDNELEFLPYYFIDQGEAPDFNTVPPAGTNPFAISGGSVSYPGAVAYFQQRLIFGRSDAKPSTFWGSAIGNFLNFDQPDFVTDSDSYDFPLDALKLEEIRSIVPQRELLLFTSSSEMVASGSNGGVGGAITPSSIDARPSSRHGSSYLDPQVADHSVLDVTAKGCYIRDLQYDWRSASYTGRDITSLVRHLLDGHTIVDWFYAETPDNLIWIMRDDGVVLSLTYEQDFQVVAFAQHTSNQAILGAAPGLFQRVCSVPEGTEDAVYFVVQRPVSGQPQNYIERLSSRFIDGPNGPADYRQVCFLDCAFTYDGRNASGPTAIVTLTPTSNAGQFIATVINAAPFAVTDVEFNNNLVLRPDGVPQPGVDDQPGTPLPPLVGRIVAFTSSSAVTIEAPLAPADFALYTGTSDWAIARKTFTGLDALDGCAVGALADGEADLGGATDTVLARSITLTEPSVDVTIGLPYFSDLQTLDTVGYRTNKRQVQSASIEVVNSRAFSVGENFNRMNALRPRNVADGYGLSPLLNGQQPLSMANAWNTSGAICVRMKDPLPLTIVSIVRTLEIGGKG